MRLCAELWLVYMLAADGIAHVGPRFRKWAIKAADEALAAYFDAIERELSSINANAIWTGLGGPDAAHRLAVRGDTSKRRPAA
jgi:hypothetical protein